jgi:hypothetical protein
MLKFASIAALIATALVALPGSGRAGLLLNEFLAAPARDWDGNGTISTRDDEWVEVVNVGGASVDLAEFFLTDGDTIPRCGFTGLLGPGQRRLVFGSDAVTWERATGHPVYGLSLGNTGDKVMLWQVVAGDTTLVDWYAYLSHEAAADRAVGRGTDGGAWMLFDALNPYSGSTPPLGTGCAPSPGAPNVCGVTPALRTTWGRIKAIYR